MPPGGPGPGRRRGILIDCVPAGFAASGIGPGIGRDPAAWTVAALVPVAVAVAAVLGGLAARRAARAEVSELVRYE